MQKKEAEERLDFTGGGYGILVKIGSESYFRPVAGYMETCTKFKEETGYIDNGGTIWIFKTNKPMSSVNKFPYFWFTDEGRTEMQFSNPDEDVLAQFSVSRLRNSSVNAVQKRLNESEEQYTAEMLSDMNAATSIYKPIVGESDDFLKRIVKHVMLDKNIDISRLKSKMNARYVLPNMLAALKNGTRTSTTYFDAWAPLLSFDYAIIAYDNGADKLDPLKKPIVYLSSYNDVFTLQEALEKLNKDGDLDAFKEETKDLKFLQTELKRDDNK